MVVPAKETLHLTNYSRTASCTTPTRHQLHPATYTFVRLNATGKANCAISVYSLLLQLGYIVIMPTQHIKAIDIDRINPMACCCDCSTEVADAPEDEIWTFWNEKLFYCPKCAGQKTAVAERSALDP